MTIFALQKNIPRRSSVVCLSENFLSQRGAVAMTIRMLHKLSLMHLTKPRSANYSYARLLQPTSPLFSQRPLPKMHRHHNAVPTIREVIPGAGVNIVLKQDQPTGRTVSGIVRDVLTRGNHPRGIKVRLADGRVGRVQSIASGEAKPAGGDGDLTFEGTGAPAWGGDDGQAFRPRRGRRAEEDDVPPAQVGLDAYIKPARQRGKRRGNAASGASGVDEGSAEQTGSGETAASEQQEAGIARCPVCEDFEGDEAAVAHHVAGHFDA